MSPSVARLTQISLFALALTASFGCGDGEKSSVSCDQLKTKVNACSQAVKDAFAPFCATTTDECRQCLDGLPNLCDNTEACDPQCKKK